MVYLRGWGWVGFGFMADVVVGEVELGLSAVGVVVLLLVLAWPPVVACGSKAAAGVALALRSPLLLGSLLFFPYFLALLHQWLLWWSWLWLASCEGGGGCLGWQVKKWG